MRPEEIRTHSADDRIMFWQRLDLPGSEYCTLVESSGGWLFDGTVLLALDAAPLRVRYRISCDAAWQTRTVEIVCMEELEERTVRITVDVRQRWWIEGVERADLRGCLDIDLGVTPATNTLPIRRLGLAIGASEEIAAAWVRFPAMTITRATQRYTRVAAMRYRYESGTYRTEIDVDDSGFVTRYPEGWERVLPKAG
jgi:hypothetical protein